MREIYRATCNVYEDVWASEADRLAGVPATHYHLALEGVTCNAAMNYSERGHAEMARRGEPRRYRQEAAR